MRRVMAAAEHIGRSFHRKDAKVAKIAKKDSFSFAFFATLAPWR